MGQLINILYENIYLQLLEAFNKFEILNIGAFSISKIISTLITMVILFFIIYLPIKLIYKGFETLLGGIL